MQKVKQALGLAMAVLIVTTIPLFRSLFEGGLRQVLSPLQGTVIATVESVRVIRSTKPRVGHPRLCTIAGSYWFIVDGEDSGGFRFGPFPGSWKEPEANAIVARLTSTHQLTVRYDPASPRTCYAEVGEAFNESRDLTLCRVWLVAVGTIVVAWMCVGLVAVGGKMPSRN